MTNGKKCFIIDYGNITSNTILEQNHTGSITQTNTGFVLTDSDGSSYVFVNSMMASY